MPGFISHQLEIAIKSAQDMQQGFIGHHQNLALGLAQGMQLPADLGQQLLHAVCGGATSQAVLGHIRPCLSAPQVKVQKMSTRGSAVARRRPAGFRYLTRSSHHYSRSHRKQADRRS